MNKEELLTSTISSRESLSTIRNKHDSKSVISISILIFTILFMMSLASDAHARCYIGCGDKEDRKEESKGININLGALGIGNKDGGDDRKKAAGDKSKNQGYAEYKRFAIGIMISMYAVPYQDGNRYTGADGVSGFFEHNMSEYFLIGVINIDQKFQHLDDDFSNQSIRHKHLAGYAGIRTWITNRAVATARIGMADSKVSYLDEEFSGSTEYLSFSLAYAMSEDDSSRVGYRYNSIIGKDKSGLHNIGMSAHGITFQVLF